MWVKPGHWVIAACRENSHTVVAVLITPSRGENASVYGRTQCSLTQLWMKLHSQRAVCTWGWDANPPQAHTYCESTLSAAIMQMTAETHIFIFPVPCLPVNRHLEVYDQQAYFKIRNWLHIRTMFNIIISHFIISNCNAGIDNKWMDGCVWLSHYVQTNRGYESVNMPHNWSFIHLGPFPDKMFVCFLCCGNNSPS